MANEFKHTDLSGVTQGQWGGVDTHIADGQITNDMLYFNGTSWVRATPATILTKLSGQAAATFSFNSMGVEMATLCFDNYGLLRWYDSTAAPFTVMYLSDANNLALNCYPGKDIFIARGVAGHAEIGVFGGARADALDQDCLISFDGTDPTATSTKKNGPIMLERGGVWNAGFLENDMISFNRQIHTDTAGAAAVREGHCHFKFGTNASESDMFLFTMTAGPVFEIDFKQNIDLGAYKIKGTTYYLKEVIGYGGWGVCAISDDSYANLIGSSYNGVSFAGTAAATYLQAFSSDGSTLIGMAQDTGVGLVEVLRFAGAADPYVGLGVDGNVIKATNGGLLGFFAATPITRPTGVAVTAIGIHAALIALGLITA